MNTISEYTVVAGLTSRLWIEERIADLKAGRFDGVIPKDDQAKMLQTYEHMLFSLDQAN